MVLLSIPPYLHLPCRPKVMLLFFFFFEILDKAPTILTAILTPSLLIQTLPCHILLNYFTGTGRRADATPHQQVVDGISLTVIGLVYWYFRNRHT